MTTLEEQTYPRATHLFCMTCETEMSFKSLSTAPPKDEADVDTYYDIVTCCGDPFLVAMLISDKPLFPEDNPDSETNQNNKVEENPRLGIDEPIWKYTIDDDFFHTLRGQEDDDAPELGNPKTKR